MNSPAQPAAQAGPQPAAPNPPAAPATPTPAAPTPDPAAPPGKPEEAAKPAIPEVPAATPSTLEAGGNATQAPQATNAQQRNRLLQDSSDKIYGASVGGDKVGGNKYVMTFGGRERVPLQRLGTQLSNPVRYAFEQPADWARVREAQAGKRIAVLRAAPNQGKVAAAIRLLQVPFDRPLYNLDQDVHLGDLVALLESDAKSDDPLPRGAGFLLCEPTGWGAVAGWMLQQLEAALENIDAQLVLTLSAGEALADKELLDYVIDLAAAPSRIGVFRRHLVWRIGDPELSNRVLALPEMIEEAGNWLDGDVSMKVAADLAVIVNQSLRGAVVDLDLVRRSMGERATEDFDIWFGGLPDVPMRCLAVALAVLNGLPYERVVRAAELLTDRLDGPPQVLAGDSAVMVPPWRDPFRRGRREVLRLLRATTRPDTARGDFGAAPVEIIEYSTGDYPQQVLEHVWREFRLHSELLAWLRDLAGDRNEEVRTWAGTALGLLARYAFDFVYTNALRVMALDDDSRSNREVVAYALRVPAADSRLRPLVDAVVAGLLGNREQPFGQATAARIHGISLGPLGASQALAALDRLATIDNFEIAIGIADSLADLIMQDEDRNSPLVLDRVASWQHDRHRSLVGELVFLQLARALTTDCTVPGADGADDLTTWPTLLMLADQHPDLRRGLMAMWRYVLNSGSFVHHVELALAAWADLAEADDTVRTSLSRMLAGTAALSDRTRTLVMRHVADWRAVDNLQPKPSTAYAVEAALHARNGAQ